MKQRITGLDLLILAREIDNEVLNYRLLNVYNLLSSPRQFLLKFSQPDLKKVLVLDCGNKLYLSNFERQTAASPSNFVTKLRKHLKTRRVTKIKQLGSDRILVLEFSDGLYYLVLEFFSAGNILLLDDNRKILSLQRMVQDKGDNDRYAVNEEYKMFDETFKDEHEHESGPEPEVVHYHHDVIQQWISKHKQELIDKKDMPSKKKCKMYSLKKLLFVNASYLSSELILKQLHEDGINGSAACVELYHDEDNLKKVCRSMEKADVVYRNLVGGGEVDGCIVKKKGTGSQSEVAAALYQEFHPFKPYKEQNEDLEFLQFKGYNRTLDEFFSAIESSKNTLRIEQRKQQAEKRLNFAREEKHKQVQNLVDQQELNVRKGDAIIQNAEDISLAQEAVQVLIDQLMDWTNIESLIKLEQTRGNKIAQLISLPLDLEKNRIKIVLPDHSFDDFSDNESPSDSETDSSDSDSDASDLDGDAAKSETDSETSKDSKKQKNKKPTLSVWVDLTLSPYKNALLYFNAKKTAGIKQVKVEKNAEMALKNAERKITQDLNKNLKLENEALKQIRPKFWFEKFFWFISSDGYLCLAGRDASQTDMIYFRHSNDNDFYVTSDIEGLLQVIIKNPYKGQSIPPSTIMQAGIYSMSSSIAWSSKVTTSPWILPVSLILKRDIDGTILENGSFRYLSKKEYLPPVQLNMGFGLLWMVNDETAAKYRKKRTERESDHVLALILDNKKQDLEGLRSAFKKGEVAENVEIEEVIEEEGDKEVAGDEEGEKGDTDSKANEIYDDVDADEVDDTETVSTLPSLSNQNVRGKKSKLKKIATKYGEQDEEERRLRMEALGTLKQIEKREQEQKEKLIEAKLADSTKRQAAANRKVQKKKQEERELRRYFAGDVVEEDESSVTNYKDILDSLVFSLQPSDEMTDIVPVFAPWTSLAKYKYKAKVQPGLGKKGKALNDILNYFSTRKMDPKSLDLDLDWPREREVVKNAKNADLIGCFTVNKVKLVLPGGSGGDGKGKKQLSGKKRK